MTNTAPNPTSSFAALFAPDPAEAAARHRGEVAQRFASFQPTPAQLLALSISRANFQAFADAIVTGTNTSREQSLALTALEEAKYWTNQNIARNGLPKPTTEPTPATPEVNILNLPIEQDDVDNTPTLGGYLAALLVALLTEGESFSGKRPLGNSGWEGFIDDALDAHDEATGEVISWGDVRVAITEALTGVAA